MTDVKISRGGNAHTFRTRLMTIMPGYSWTVHRAGRNDTQIIATGTRSSGFNRTSTLRVIWNISARGNDTYRAMSAGYGAKSPWVKEYTDTTLALALRGLQLAYEHEAQKFRACAAALQSGRQAPQKNAGDQPS